MPRLIDRNGLRDDSWAVLGADDALPDSDAGDVLVPLARFSAQREALAARSGRTGVLLAPDDDPFALADALDALALIAVSFPKFTDGRGRSSARLLRERMGWHGELRAVGDVLRDQIFHLARCGFDTFALRDDQEVDVAMTAFADFTEAYQAGTDRRGLFERRAPAQRPAGG